MSLRVERLDQGEEQRGIGRREYYLLLGSFFRVRRIGGVVECSGER